MSIHTEDEMANEVLGWLKRQPVEVQEEFRNRSRESLVFYHNTLGRKIRNEFKLWETEWKPVYEKQNNITVDASESHPDAISMRVIEKVWLIMQEVLDDKS